VEAEFHCQKQRYVSNFFKPKDWPNDRMKLCQKQLLKLKKLTVQDQLEDSLDVVVLVKQVAPGSTVAERGLVSDISLNGHSI